MLPRFLQFFPDFKLFLALPLLQRWFKSLNTIDEIKNSRNFESKVNQSTNPPRKKNGGNLFLTESCHRSSWSITFNPWVARAADPYLWIWRHSINKKPARLIGCTEVYSMRFGRITLVPFSSTPCSIVIRKGEGDICRAIFTRCGARNSVDTRATDTDVVMSEILKTEAPRPEWMNVRQGFLRIFQLFRQTGLIVYVCVCTFPS